MKILNLYAGIGGNRRLWGNEHEITAVEIDPKIAEIYQHYFPDDEIVIADAHEFLRENYRDFDFIWSSPPCPTHSRARWWRWKDEKPVYPDMRLWQEIIFLKYHAKSRWVVENVIPYYELFITPTARIGRHYFWANFYIPPFKVEENYKEAKDDITAREREFGYDLSVFKLPSELRKKVVRNMVHPAIGLHVLRAAATQIIEIFEYEVSK